MSLLGGMTNKPWIRGLASLSIKAKLSKEAEGSFLVWEMGVWLLSVDCRLELMGLMYSLTTQS